MNNILKKCRIAMNLTKEICRHEIKAFNFKKIFKITRKELENPGKDLTIKKQDSQGLPVSIYLQYPKKENPNYWYVYYITDKMQYAEMESFNSESSAKRYIDSVIDKYRRMNERKEQRKKEREENRIDFKHSYKVGDVIVCIWGYDQTNVDFYVVKEVGEKSIKIVEVGSKFVKYTDNGNNLVVPDIKKETGKIMTKIVKPGDRIKIYSFADGYKWNGRPVEETSAYNAR